MEFSIMDFDGHASIPACIVGNVHDYAKELQTIANRYGSAHGYFNGTRMNAKRGDTPKEILPAYFKARGE